MYATLPFIRPVSSVRCAIFAIPKSTTFTLPSYATRMFAGEDIAVHDAGEAAIRPAVLVRVVERGRRRERDRDAVLERHPALVLGHVREEPAQILAVHVLHREEVLAVLLADVVDVDDVVVVQRRREPRLVEEHLHEPRVARAVVADLLDDHVALEPLDPSHPRQDHLCHSTRREVANELVLAQAQSW